MRNVQDGDLARSQVPLHAHQLTGEDVLELLVREVGALLLTPLEHGALGTDFGDPVDSMVGGCVTTPALSPLDRLRNISVQRGL